MAYTILGFSIVYAAAICMAHLARGSIHWLLLMAPMLAGYIWLIVEDTWLASPTSSSSSSSLLATEQQQRYQSGLSLIMLCLLLTMMRFASDQRSSRWRYAVSTLSAFALGSLLLLTISQAWSSWVSSSPSILAEPVYAFGLDAGIALLVLMLGMFNCHRYLDVGNRAETLQGSSLREWWFPLLAIWALSCIINGVMITQSFHEQNPVQYLQSIHWVLIPIQCCALVLLTFAVYYIVPRSSSCLSHCCCCCGRHCKCCRRLCVDTNSGIYAAVAQENTSDDNTLFAVE